MRHTVTEHTLSTGTKGLLIDVPGSEVVSLQVYFKAGYQFGDFTKYDIPHLIEHYVFSGTKGYPGPDQIAVEIGRNGAYLSASTNDSSIRFVAECAEFEVEHILELMTELITRPIFPPKVYETERENVRTELTSYLSNYNREVSRLSGEASFPKRIMNYNKRLEQLDGITRQDVIDYYQATFHARNAVFLVSGAVKAQQATIQRKLEELFGELPVGQPREFIDEVGLGIPKPLLIVESIDSVYFNLNWFNAGLTMEERAAGTILGVILTGSYA